MQSARFRLWTFQAPDAARAGARHHILRCTFGACGLRKKVVSPGLAGAWETDRHADVRQSWLIVAIAVFYAAAHTDIH